MSDVESDKYWIETLLPGWIESLKKGKRLSSWEKSQLSCVLSIIRERMKKELNTRMIIDEVLEHSNCAGESSAMIVQNERLMIDNLSLRARVKELEDEKIQGDRGYKIRGTAE